ncbi:pyrin domain-containing protein 1-like isoform X2 [Lithobates pipiens]
MARTVKDALLRALEDLNGSSFKRFRNKLMDWDIKDGFDTIPRSKLEKADTDDVVQLIVSFYKDCYGAELTVDVLNAINEKQVASDLKKALENEPTEEPVENEHPRASSGCIVC